MQSRKRRLRKGFWSPLTFEGFGVGGEDILKVEQAGECRFMQTSGGETFKEGMVSSVKCYRRVGECGDQEQATGLDTGDNRKNFGKDRSGMARLQKKAHRQESVSSEYRQLSEEVWERTNQSTMAYSGVGWGGRRESSWGIGGMKHFVDLGKGAEGKEQVPHDPPTSFFSPNPKPLASGGHSGPPVQQAFNRHLFPSGCPASVLVQGQSAHPRAAGRQPNLSQDWFTC